MMSTVHRWTIGGADGQPIFGDTHVPAGPPRGTLVLCHGFKGYKDYGFFPYLADQGARSGLITCRFNFSHSGMTLDIETFARPDLFEQDTWDKQIFDLDQVACAIRSSNLPGFHTGTSPELPMTWFGHSRGGVTILLAASRPTGSPPNRVIAAAAPHSACDLDEHQRRLLHAQGWLESPSSRTGQILRMGSAWLDELEANPSAFDPLNAIGQIPHPVLLIHGSEDDSVPIGSAHQLREAGRSTVRLETIEGASHTFNAPNPMALDQASRVTEQLAHSICAFAGAN